MKARWRDDGVREHGGDEARDRIVKGPKQEGGRVEVPGKCGVEATEGPGA